VVFGGIGGYIRFFVYTKNYISKDKYQCICSMTQQEVFIISNNFFYYNSKPYIYYQCSSSGLHIILKSIASAPGGCLLEEDHIFKTIPIKFNKTIESLLNSYAVEKHLTFNLNIKSSIIKENLGK
jgi:hypothetical protein